MNTFTIPLKRKVIGFQNSADIEEYDEQSDTIYYDNDYQVEKGLHTSFDSSEQNISVLQNRINLLEVALQETREEAFQVGFEEGKEVAQSEASKQIEDVSEEFGAMARSLQFQFNQALEKMDEPLVKLAVKIAKKIIGRELKHWNEYNDVLAIKIKHLLHEVADQNKITVYVNPNQADWVRGGEVLKNLNIPSKTEINFVINDDLNPGECSIETEDYSVEGMLSRQLDNLENEILDKGRKWKD